MKESRAFMTLAVLTAIVVSMFGLSPTPSYAGADDEYRKLPGYVDFDAMGVFGQEEASVEVFLKGAILDIVRAALHEEEPDLAELLTNVRLIRVHVFPLEDRDSSSLKKNAKSFADKLEKKGWEMAVRVKEDDEQVYIYLLPGKKNDIDGLVIMAIEDDEEAAFINIVGNMDPSAIGKLGRLHLPVDLRDLEDYDTRSKRSTK